MSLVNTSESLNPSYESSSMDSEHLATNLSKLVDGVKTIFPSVLDDIKEVNDALQEIVSSSNETLDTSNDPKVSFEVEKFKQMIKDELTASDCCRNAAESVATYASDDRTLKEIKEELSKGNQQKLKRYLEVVKNRLKNCHGHLEAIQTDYYDIYRVAVKHRERLSEVGSMRKLLLVAVQAAKYGLTLIGIVGFVVTKHLLSSSCVETLPILPRLNESIPRLNESIPRLNESIPRLNESIPRLNESTNVVIHRLHYDQPQYCSSLYYYIVVYYLIPITFGLTVGLSCFYMAKRLSLYHPPVLASRKAQGISLLRSAEDTILSFQSKLKKTIGKLQDLEHYLYI